MSLPLFSTVLQQIKSILQKTVTIPGYLAHYNSNQKNDDRNSPTRSETQRGKLYCFFFCFLCSAQQY